MDRGTAAQPEAQQGADAEVPDGPVVRHPIAWLDGTQAALGNVGDGRDLCDARHGRGPSAGRPGILGRRRRGGHGWLTTDLDHGRGARHGARQHHLEVGVIQRRPAEFEGRALDRGAAGPVCAQELGRDLLGNDAALELSFDGRQLGEEDHVAIVAVCIEHIAAGEVTTNDGLGQVMDALGKLLPPFAEALAHVGERHHAQPCAGGGCGGGSRRNRGPRAHDCFAAARDRQTGARRVRADCLLIFSISAFAAALQQTLG